MIAALRKQGRPSFSGLLYFTLAALIAGSVLGQSGGQTLYNGIVLPPLWPPSQNPTQAYKVPSYISNPPPVIPINVGRQLFVDDFLIQQTTMTRTQQRPVVYPLNPILTPTQSDAAGLAMPFSDGVWFDPSDQLFKMWFHCGNGDQVCYAYSTDGKTWIRPSIPDAVVPNSDVVLQASPTDPPFAGLIVWMDLQDPNPARKFKAFLSNSSTPALLYFSPDGIHWTATITSEYPMPIFDRTTFFWNPFRNMWVDSNKAYTTLPAEPTRPEYVSRARNYLESVDLKNWTPSQPVTSSFWTGPDVNDPPYSPGGPYPQLYNLDAVGYESLMVGLFSWYYPLEPDVVDLGVGFSRDGFQWVRPTRGSGPGPNGAFIPASNVPGTWNMGNTQSAGGGFLVVGDELWFYFSGRTGLHSNPNVVGSTGLATLRRDGFYSMDAGPAPAFLTTRPVQFSGKYLFVNVKDPQGSLQVEVLNPSGGAVLATSLPLTADKTLQQVTWNGLSDLSGFANQPVQFRFTLTNGSLYSFWVAANTSGASNGYVAANGPGFTGPTDTLGIAAYPNTVVTPQIFPAAGTISGATAISITTSTVGATIRYTTDGTTPSAASPQYTGPFQLPVSATVKAIALAPGLNQSAVSATTFTVNNVLPTVSLTAPSNGQAVSGSITLSANASDAVGITNVQFLIDGVPVGTVNAAPYTISIQTTTLTNTSHQISAVATDTVGNQASAQVTVTVNNVINGGPTTGLVGYWSFDSSYLNGSSVLDQSGNNSVATAASTISVFGKVGQAVTFNGSTSVIQVTSSLSNPLYDLAGDLSLSVWVRTTNSSRYEALISKYAAGGVGSGYLLRTTPAGKAELFLGINNVAVGPSVATDVTTINNAQWHHIAVIVKLGQSVTFYVDGALSSTQPINTVAGSAASNFSMGVNSYTPYGTYFTGNLDEVRVYNRALTASEVSALYYVISTPPPPPATAAFLNLDLATQGNWKASYGRDGYVIANDSNSAPLYGTVNFSDAGTYSWNGSTADPRALLKAGSATDRIASTYFGAVGFSIDVNLTDGQTHQVGLYVLDWETGGRAETFSVLDANTGIELDRRSVSNFANGQYLIWNLNGHVLFNITRISGVNAVVSGVLLGGALGPDLTIALTPSGVFKQGDAADTYTMTVTNTGVVPTSGTISVADIVPFGLTATGISGSGWNCTQPSGPCLRNDTLNSGASYPAITLTVSVASNAPSSVTTTATVSGGGESHLNNDTANALTAIASTSTAPSFITGYALNGPPLRNDFSGWVGMKLTVGADTLSIASIGRVCVFGNSGSHIVKFVSASTGTDIPGGSALLSMAGCVPGQFAYGGPSGAVTLQPNTSYYLVSQEVNTGDQWYDRGTITSTADAAVNSSVYSFDGSVWTPSSAVNTSYVPVNFQYSVIPTVKYPVTVQANPAGASFTVDGTAYTTPQLFNWPSGSPHTIAAASPQNGPAGTQYAWNDWSDGGAASHTVFPTSATTLTANFTARYVLTAGVSSSAAGSIAVSPPSATGYYDSGTLVQLTATANTGCTLVNWTGDVSGSSNPLPVTMSGPRAVTANFQCGPPPIALLTSYAYYLSSQGLRNDFSGWVGMKLTLGPNALSVSALGRICVAGNSGTHTVKLVNASTGVDMPNGSVTLNLAGCTADTFSYAALASPITLPAGTSYYLVTQELNGGDRWYDYGAVSSTSDAAINAPVYSAGASWVVVNGGNASSYVPPNFLYSVVQSSTIAVTVQTSPSGASFSVDGSNYNAAQVFNWVPGSSHTIATVNSQNVAGAQYSWSSWSDGGGISHNVAPSSPTSFTANFTTQYLLSAASSPVSGGSIGANPSSGTGYYNNGSPVQLTATPAANCTFVSWSGDLSGSVNPQTVTMSTARSVTASFQCNLPPTPLIAGFALNNPSLRNDFSGWVGMRITVGANPLLVSSLGRVCVAGNSGTHAVKLVNSGTGVDVPNGLVSVNLAGCTAGTFSYAALASPITLQAATSYHLVTQELSGDDRWYDYGGVSATSDAAVNAFVYSTGATWIASSGTNLSYVPPNFLYSIAPAPADLTISKTHSGSFTQGDTGDTYTVTVTNSGVTATNGVVSVTDSVPVGLTATAISGAGWSCTQPAGPCTRSDALNGGGSYPALTVTVNVAANAPGSVTNTATVSGGGESNTGNNTASDSTTIASGSVQVTIQTNIAGPSFSVDGTAYNTTQIFSWPSGSSHTIGAATPQSGGTGIQYVWNSWSDAGTISHTVSPSIAATYTANFSTQYLLTTTASPAAGGTINPASAWYNSGAVVPVSAAANSGSQFSGFSGGTLSGTSTPQNVTMNGPVTVTANFAALVPVTVTTVPAGLSLTVDGGSCATPCLFQWTPGSNHTIAVVTSPQAGAVGIQYVFGNWSDSGAASHSVSGPASATTFTANFTTQYFLTTTANPAAGGAINPASAWYNGGAVVPVSAAANSGFLFTGFTGGTLSGTSTPQNVTLNGPVTVTANFAALVPVTVTTAPAGLSLAVDGGSCSTPCLFQWSAGSNHTIAVLTSPQAGTVGTQYVFGNWSDNGAQSHSVSAPALATTFTANFATQYFLTTGANPAAGGTINPASGWYNSGTAVQLAPVPNSGYVFANWTGDLSGSTSQQTVTMLAPHSVTANFQAAISGITGYALNGPPLRNDFSGWVGMRLTVGANSLFVGTLGRICVAGNSGTHTIKFVNASTGIDVPGGSVSLNMAGCTAGQFSFAALASPIVLQAATPYYLISQETQGGDRWYDYGTVSAAPGVAVNSSVYFNGTSWIPVGPANSSYTPPNFQYWLGPSDAPLITGYTQNSTQLRNDFSGWVGMKFTVGAGGLAVSSLGRLFLAGNNGTHTVKLVRASDGADVPGGSVAVSMTGGTPGVFSYAPLSSQINLAANTAYYLVSQETAGGDQWYDFGAVSTTSSATVNNAVYSFSGAWILVGGANLSYVPANLK